MSGKRFKKSLRKRKIAFKGSIGSKRSNRRGTPDESESLELLEPLQPMEPSLLERVKPFGIVVADLALGGVGDIFTLQKLIDRFFHADDSFMGEIGRPE